MVAAETERMVPTAQERSRSSTEVGLDLEISWNNSVHCCVVKNTSSKVTFFNLASAFPMTRGSTFCTAVWFSDHFIPPSISSICRSTSEAMYSNNAVKSPCLQKDRFNFLNFLNFVLNIAMIPCSLTFFLFKETSAHNEGLLTTELRNREHSLSLSRSGTVRSLAILSQISIGRWWTVFSNIFTVSPTLFDRNITIF